MRSITERLLLEIRESVTCGVGMKVIDISDQGFSVQLGKSPEAIVTVTLSNPETPSFAVTYPQLIPKGRNGHESIEDCTSEGCRSEGVSWIIRKVYRYGFAPPEGYGKQQENAGRVETTVDF